MFSTSILKVVASGKPSVKEVEPRQGQVCIKVKNEQNHNNGMSRRSLLAGSLAITNALVISTKPSHANLLQDFTKQITRPDVDPVTATVMMLDARGVLLEVKELASSPLDSEMRVEYRSYIPGMARRLRDVGQAAPTVAALVFGKEKDELLSEVYGGQAQGDSSDLVDPIYRTVGNVLTKSGRGIQGAALESSIRAEDAVNAINALLDKVPKDTFEAAQDFRKSR